MVHQKQNTLCCKILIKVSTCNVNISILAWYYVNVYSFNYSIVTFFLNPGTSELYKKISSTIFFIRLRTLKPTRTRTLLQKSDLAWPKHTQMAIPFSSSPIQPQSSNFLIFDLSQYNNLYYNKFCSTSGFRMQDAPSACLPITATDL